MGTRVRKRYLVNTVLRQVYFKFNYRAKRWGENNKFNEDLRVSLRKEL